MDRRNVTYLLPLLLALTARAEDAPTAVTASDWRVVGPFELGSREGFVHHLADGQGRVPERFTFEESYPSGLVAGGRARWTPIAAASDSPGRVGLKLEGVDWAAREAEWGAASAFNVAYAAGTLHVATAGTYVVHASRCSVLLDGRPHAGDPYGADIARSVAWLSAGDHGVLVASAGHGGERAFDLRLERVGDHDPSVQVVATDVLLPELVEGSAGSGVVGVPLLNVSREWLRATIEIQGAFSGRTTTDWAIAPGAALKVPVNVTWKPPSTAAGTEASLVIEVSSRGPKARVVLGTAVRGARQSRVETFRSRVDGSAQACALLPPSEDCSECGLVVSLHGAGVGCRGQVDAHGPKDWAWVVAPTNRRPYGFDWHDWGRLDFEEVLDRSLERLHVDPDRVSLVGHSMGGHGAWLNGCLHADRLASVTPSAGWNGYDTYVPGTLRRSLWLAEPAVSELWLRGLSASRVSPLLENLVGLPIRLLHGSADDNVPPTHARLLAGMLESLGGDVSLHEVEGAGHWWDLDKDRPGADCVDSADFEATWRSARRASAPASLAFVTPDPDVLSRHHWAEVLAQRRIGELSRVEAEVIGPTAVRASTRNVTRLALRLAPPLVAGGRITVRVNGAAQVVAVPPEGARFVFEATARGWRRGRAGETDGGLRPGGFAKALFEPFVLVVGTRDAARSERLLDVARSLAQAFWVRGNGHAPIVRDVDVSDELRATRNLVLLGGADCNAEASSLARELLIASSNGSVTLAGRRLEGELASAHWQRNPRFRQRRILVLQASSPEADSLLYLFNPIGGGHGLPDFVVARPKVRTRSWAGFAACGYWSPDFAFDADSAWVETDAPHVR